MYQFPSSFFPLGGFWFSFKLHDILSQSSSISCWFPFSFTTQLFSPTQKRLKSSCSCLILFPNVCHIPLLFFNHLLAGLLWMPAAWTGSRAGKGPSLHKATRMYPFDQPGFPTGKTNRGAQRQENICSVEAKGTKAESCWVFLLL